MNLLFHSVINTHPGQIYYRIKYLFRRKLRTLLSERYRGKLIKHCNADYQFNEIFNLDYHTKKADIIHKSDNEYSIIFLNELRTFKVPFDWHRSDLNKGTRLWKLNLHYMEYLSQTDNSDFISLVNDWIASNPPYMKDYALDNWNSYALSIRTVVWMHEYSKRKEQLDDKFRKKFINSLYCQINYLYDNPELDIGGNHIIKNIKALLWAGIFFNSSRSEEWIIKGETLLDRELEHQILNDGMHYELSPSYHCQVFLDLLECYNAVHNSELKKKLYSVLSKMVKVVSDLTMSDGYIAQFSDGGYHMAPSPAVCLNAWKQSMNKVVTQSNVFSLTESGYYGIHNSDMDFIADCGKIGADNLPAHGHADILSFELCLNKQRMIVDTGVFEYNPGKKRSFSRSTKAHNTVTLDDFDQGELYSSFRLGRRASVQVKNFTEYENGFELTAVHDGYKILKNRPMHQRTFIVTGKIVVIKDLISGGASQKVKSRVLIHPECIIVTKDNAIFIKHRSSEIRIETEHEYSIVDSTWFPDFGVELPCHQIVIDYGFAPCSGEYVIYTSDKGEPDILETHSMQSNPGTVF